MFHADAIGCLEWERARDVSARYKRFLKPQGRITYKLSTERVVLVKIKKYLRGHIADISIYSHDEITESKSVDLVDDED